MIVHHIPSPFYSDLKILQNGPLHSRTLIIWIFNYPELIFAHIKFGCVSKCCVSNHMIQACMKLLFSLYIWQLQMQLKYSYIATVWRFVICIYILPKKRTCMRVKPDSWVASYITMTGIIIIIYDCRVPQDIIQIIDLKCVDLKLRSLVRFRGEEK